MKKVFKFLFCSGNVNEKKQEEFKRIFRNLFLTREGVEVLRILLNDWCFFGFCRNKRDRIMNEYAKFFLNERLGLADINVYTELDIDRLEKEKEG